MFCSSRFYETLNLRRLHIALSIYHSTVLRRSQITSRVVLRPLNWGKATIFPSEVTFNVTALI
jgi:hypothetical protein